MTPDRHPARPFRFLAVVLAVVAGGVAALAPGATAAEAENRISLTGVSAPVGASAALDHSCTGVRPVVGKDGWAFELPAGGARFTVVRIALVDVNGGVYTFETRGDGALLDGGRRAMVRSNPPGLTLTGAVADITGSAPAFTLTRTCPSPPGWKPTSPSPSPAPVVVPSSRQPAGSGDDGTPTKAAAKTADASPSGWTAAAYVALALLLVVAVAAAALLVRRRTTRPSGGE